MDLSKLILPSTVIVEGSFFTIQTSHPYWFRFAQLIKGEVKFLTDFDFLYKGKIPQDRQKGFLALLDFFKEKKLLPREDKTSNSTEIALDYDLDSDLIYAAILDQYGIDILEKEIHWHKMRAMINGLHGTKLNEIISYRLYEPPKKNETHDSVMKKLQRLWHIPNEEDKKAEKMRNRFNNLLKKK